MNAFGKSINLWQPTPTSPPASKLIKLSWLICQNTRKEEREQPKKEMEIEIEIVFRGRLEAAYDYGVCECGSECTSSGNNNKQNPMIMPQISGWSGSATRNNEVTCLLLPIVFSTVCQPAVPVQVPTHSVLHLGTQSESSSYEWKSVCTPGAISDEFRQWKKKEIRLQNWSWHALTTTESETAA